MTVLHAGHPEATRVAVDLPQGFCGAASLALRSPDSIQAVDNGAGTPQSWEQASASLGNSKYDGICEGSSSLITKAFLSVQASAPTAAVAW